VNNRRFNSFGNRAYVITHSIKKMKKEDKEVALSTKQFRKIGSEKFIDISTLDESDKEVYNSIYYKEIPLVTGDMDETVIITYSPKYKAYQQKIRNKQLDSAQKIIDGKIKKRKGKNQNDPARFVKETKFTNDGEIAEKSAYELDHDRINEETRYDGFYAVVTNIEDNIEEILKINKQRWQIEENFRIMKTDFEARPVYVRRDDRIKAHFLTCYISLLVYRLLEKKLDDKYTCEETLSTLREMKMTLLSGNSGYVPSYKRTELTDALHDTFGFRTDYEFITKASMRTIIKNTKNGTNGKN
jgi:transposase